MTKDEMLNLVTRLSRDDKKALLKTLMEEMKTEDADDVLQMFDYSVDDA